MAKFNGTLKEFDKYFGPRLRNVVQTSIARKLRNDVGKCEMCGTQDDLQAAHVHGADRKTLIKKALNDYLHDDIIIDGEIELFEQKFKDLHNPPEQIFKILCRQCHNKYDNVKEVITDETEDVTQINELSIENNNSVLPIEFIPEDIPEFKELLLINKRAIITIYYNGGTTEVKEWNAYKITEKSDIIRNLRSRNEFRQGNWQDSNIKSIKVEIDEINLK